MSVFKIRAALRGLMKPSRTELIVESLGGWAGHLATTFRRPPTKKWLELQKQKKTPEKSGEARPSSPKMVGRTPVQPLLR